MRFKTHLHHLQDFLAGRKTYIIAMAGIIALAIGWHMGSVSTPNAIEQMVALVLAMCIRQGVTREVKKVKEPPVAAPAAPVAPPVAETIPVLTAVIEPVEAAVEAPAAEKDKKKAKHKKGKHG